MFNGMIPNVCKIYMHKTTADTPILMNAIFRNPRFRFSILLNSSISVYSNLGLRCGSGCLLVARILPAPMAVPAMGPVADLFSHGSVMPLDYDIEGV
jgi:hypothetical protein